ncbi:hypothetical protein BAUCODRAFT_74420 [Baudoinia panamericana UAMH 10762]|uniref:Uncharacterized protein n=1 Tax=Baudoinia panamericana (strain UAMH 10762) TaxID=717646 RepID=M2MB90_BAUPA|nr:uncharacterized protein BAUCODRAFT_74420 [Baudoinia panamericana UAMH 10762]EMC93756.1 hypothetical protein BAUCODRAFT_74420 [Baudoinia panamericana UAMH 10762]
MQPALTEDEVDDLLHFTRVNEAQELQDTTSELSKKYGCQPQQVIEACKDPESSNTILHFCSANGFADLLHGILSTLGFGDSKQAGVSVGSSLLNAQNREGNTPLHWAAYNGHLAVVKLLVQAGADMWVKNAAGHLAMFEAERADRSEVVQYLLEMGGREVERTGREGQVSRDDEVELQDGSGAAGPSDGNGQAEVDRGRDAEMADTLAS